MSLQRILLTHPLPYLLQPPLETTNLNQSPIHYPSLNFKVTHHILLSSFICYVYGTLSSLVRKSLIINFVSLSLSQSELISMAIVLTNSSDFVPLAQIQEYVGKVFTHNNTTQHSQHIHTTIHLQTHILPFDLKYKHNQTEINNEKIEKSVIWFLFEMYSFGMK
jgi:hypothetical protein